MVMTREELLSRRDILLIDKDENNRKIADCRAQIDRAKAEFKNTGIHADNDWYASVKAAARYAGQRDQEIAGELSSLSAELKLLNVMEETAQGRLAPRDHFAMACLTGLMITESLTKIKTSKEYTIRIKAASEVAYDYADAMMEARKNHAPQNPLPSPETKETI